MPILVDPPVEPDASPTQEVAAWLITRLGAAEVQAFEVDELDRLRNEGSFPDDYAELYLSTRGRGVRRADGTSDVLGYRVQVRVVCKYVDNAYLLLDRTRGALYGANVPVGDGLSSPIDEGPAEMPRPDDGWYSALTEWTFTL